MITHSNNTMQKSDKKNKNLIDRINFWQNFKYIKPLVCRNENCGASLVPLESRGRVILKCPKCGRVQTKVPRTLLKTKLAIPGVLLRNKYKNR
jgi:hypothetical protein